MTQDLKTRLQQQQAVENQANSLVKMAEDALNPRMNRLMGGQSLKTAQFNNLLGVALETSSPEVVVNWLSYQMGRRTPDTRGWKESGLGDQVILDIKKLADAASGIADISKDGAKTQEVQILLIRQYLGYLKRWFIAKGGGS